MRLTSVRALGGEAFEIVVGGQVYRAKVQRISGTEIQSLDAPELMAWLNALPYDRDVQRPLIGKICRACLELDDPLQVRDAGHLVEVLEHWIPEWVTASIIYGTVKTESDEPGHPYGQWSGRLERASAGWRLALLVRGAHERLRRGEKVELFHGPTRLAILRIL